MWHSAVEYEYSTRSRIDRLHDFVFGVVEHNRFTGPIAVPGVVGVVDDGVAVLASVGRQVCVDHRTISKIIGVHQGVIRLVFAAANRFVDDFPQLRESWSVVDIAIA